MKKSTPRENFSRGCCLFTQKSGGFLSPQCIGSDTRPDPLGILLQIRNNYPLLTMCILTENPRMAQPCGFAVFLLYNAIFSRCRGYPSTPSRGTDDRPTDPAEMTPDRIRTDPAELIRPNPPHRSGAGVFPLYLITTGAGLNIVKPAQNKGLRACWKCLSTI